MSTTRAELAGDLSSGNAAMIATALTSAALHDSDQEYVESLIVKFIRHDDPWVRGVSALAAGLHRTYPSATLSGDCPVDRSPFSG